MQNVNLKQPPFFILFTRFPAKTTNVFFACGCFKDNRDNRDNFLICYKLAL